MAKFIVIPIAMSVKNNRIAEHGEIVDESELNSPTHDLVSGNFIRPATEEEIKALGKVVEETLEKDLEEDLDDNDDSDKDLDKSDVKVDDKSKDATAEISKKDAVKDALKSKK